MTTFLSLRNMFARSQNRLWLLLGLWGVLTGLNLNKAYHIDDTFHLEAAAHLAKDPAHPMSGQINWENRLSPMFQHNQPPLFFYLIALTSRLFGDSEPVLHLLLSVFTLLSLYFFHKLLDLLAVRNGNLLLCLFAFSPAFIVNQNLMVDVPVLSVVLGALYFLLRAKRSGKMRDYALSALCIGIGLLIKYSVLPLLVVLAMVIALRWEPRMFRVLLIPVGMLVLWSVWNKMEFNGVHLLGRPRYDFKMDTLWEFFACLGAISAFGMSFVCGVIRSGWARAVVYAGLGVFVMCAGFLYADMLDEKTCAKLLNYAFLANGLILVAALAWQLGRSWKQEWAWTLLSDGFIIFLFAGAIGAFIVRYAPFIATRHLLLLIPLLLLLGNKLLEQAPAGINRLMTGTTIALGLLLGISDWYYAEYYRYMARTVPLPNDATVWTAGHWGWQWYINHRAGTQQYQKDSSQVHPGDYLLYPANISMQSTKYHIDYQVIHKYWREAGPEMFFSGNNFASLYNSFMNKPPWTLSKRPADTIFLCRVIRGPHTLVAELKADSQMVTFATQQAEIQRIAVDSMLMLEAKRKLVQEQQERTQP